MSIILIGYRGSGKTTLGGRLAARLGWGFADLDQRITAAAGLSIGEIFSRYGEGEFRAIESRQLEQIVKLKDHVISLGGGAVLAESNQTVIRGSGHTVVYLHADAAELHRRIIADPATADSRPGLTALGGSAEEVANLLGARLPIYRQLKHIELDVNSMPVDTLVETLHAQLRSSAQ
jgi:shikimate kinase